MLKSIFRKREYNIWQSFLIVFLMTTGLLVFQTVMQNGNDFEAYMSQLRHPYVLVGNFVPVFVMLSVLFLLTNSIRWSFVPTALVLNILLIINHYKIIFRDVPLKPADMTLGKEMVSIIQNYTIPFSWRVVLCTAALWLVGIFVICCVRNKKTGLLVRLSAALVFIAGFACMYKFFYTNENIYRNK